jgi:hypothetical protein
VGFYTLVPFGHRQREEAVFPSAFCLLPSAFLDKINIVQKRWLGGVVLYSIPLGKDRCRILLRNYGNFFTWKLRNLPLWLDHILVRNKILEGDLQLVVQQKAQVERLGQNLKQVYLPLKTSDILVIEYRKWLDKFGSSLPFYQGYASAKNIDGGESNPILTPLDRFSQHTQICSSCNQAYQTTNKLKQIFIGVAIALAAIAILVNDSNLKIATVSAALVAVGLVVMAQKLKIQFERSYTRH